MTDAIAADEPADKANHKRDRPSPEVAQAAKRLKKFAAAHGGASSTHIEYVSRGATRVVIVGQDGRWGDQMLASEPDAQLAAAEAGLEVSESWDRESTGSVRTGPAEWTKMGGRH